MTGRQGDVGLLEDPVAQELLGSRELARLAYTWTDGALARDARVAVTIDQSTSWPYRALLLRGNATVEMLDDVSEEYAAAARRYFGDEQGEAWVNQLAGKPMARISVTPTWVTVLDFETRFPSALSA
jgi:hypothetical protein